ncbi:hypothetical protein NO932_11660 [Pelagibacterium sp. 26DY04]|uniref:hypothetical protein n=1 Tax=Pelagibacterium sp. 26DY04 TaxID=2967130 RepID=UPI0028162274|nr:hypothetical protein [Pelagibacterium sp. 26DY04]WMT85584.1 hypothetical protein NO932_11660 [Pelagibacterium sp. 26DY04]
MGRHSKPAHNRAEGKREPSGRINRKGVGQRKRDAHDKAEREMMSVAIGARQRIFGLNAKLARDQLSGSVVGRLALMGMQGGGISRQQADAAFIWLEDRAAYAKVMQSPKDDSAIDLAHVPGISHGENVERAKMNRKRYERAREALQQAQNVLGGRSNLWAAINLIVEQDKDMPHLIGDLREALNALCRHYKIPTPVNRKAVDMTAEAV